MADVLDPGGNFASWEVMLARGARRSCEGTFRDLLLNLKARPELRPPDERQVFFMEESWSPGPPRVWQFCLPAGQLSEEEIANIPRATPHRSFRREGPHLLPMSFGSPGPEVLLHRIIVGTPPSSRSRTYFGPWQGQNPLVQCSWSDGTALTDSSTAQLRRLQVNCSARPHNALSKWEATLGCPLPIDIWQLTWMSFRSAVENTFLWQILYQILATQKWRFPGRSAGAQETWCSRCTTGMVEDTYHCVWGCPTARSCWKWVYRLLQVVSQCPPSPIHLRPEHVLIASPFPSEWAVPSQLWHSLRAILCWLIWKDRNSHVFGGDRSNVHRVCGLAWQRLTVYMHVAWRQLRERVRQDRLLLRWPRSLVGKALYGPFMR